MLADALGEKNRFACWPHLATSKFVRDSRRSKIGDAGSDCEIAGPRIHHKVTNWLRGPEKRKGPENFRPCAAKTEAASYSANVVASLWISRSGADAVSPSRR